jgi:hypothetical protein
VFVGRTAGESKMNGAEAAGYLKQLYDLARVRYSPAGRARRRTYRILGA